MYAFNSCLLFWRVVLNQCSSHTIPSLLCICATPETSKLHSAIHVFLNVLYFPAYRNDDDMIPKNSSVLVARVPIKKVSFLAISMSSVERVCSHNARSFNMVVLPKQSHPASNTTSSNGTSSNLTQNNPFPIYSGIKVSINFITSNIFLGAQHNFQLSGV